MIEAVERAGVGRPSVMTPANRAKVLELLRQGNTKVAAAGMAGLSRPSLFRWIQSDPTFAEEVEMAEDEAEARKLAVINAACEEGVWTASAWWLERRRPEDYGRKDQVQVISQEIAGKIAGCTVQELQKIYAMLQAGEEAPEAETAIDVPAVVEYGEPTPGSNSNDEP